MTDPRRIQVDQFLPHPPARVWQALTDPVLLARWLMPNTFRLALGHRFTFITTPHPDSGFDGVIHCQVLDFTPERRLRISWCTAGLDTTVTWTLAGEGAGTRLLLDHDGFDPDNPTHRFTRGLLDGGWRSHGMRRLAEVL
jgi:uncharacterized protein YndB with AHSA1/START domain